MPRSMRSAQPPKIPTWLLIRFGSSPNNAELIGDLAERYERGHSRLWYWRQAVVAIVVSLLNEVWNHKWLTLTAILTGWIAFRLSWEGLNLTGGLFIALGIWSRQWRHEWIWMAVWIPQVGFSGILTGWLVARLHRQAPKAMVLAYTTFFLGLQICPVVPELLRGYGAPFYILMYALSFMGITPLAVLLGSGVLGSDGKTETPKRATN